MLGLFALINKYFWALAIILTCLNAEFIWKRTRIDRSSNPKLNYEYKKLLIGYIVYLNIPWLIMGTGMIIGGVPTIFHFFRPRDGNYFVLAFHTYLIVLALISIVWIYFKGGGELINEHPAIINWINRNPVNAKVLFVLFVLGAMGTLLTMWMVNIPVPNLQGILQVNLRTLWGQSLHFPLTCPCRIH